MRLTTCAQAHPCPRCHAATVTGLTEPPAAWTAIVDPLPLDAVSEARALIGGRFTYDLITINCRPQLVYRDQFRITRRDYPVLAAHKCPGPVPWIIIPSPPKGNADDSDEVPF